MGGDATDRRAARLRRDRPRRVPRLRPPARRSSARRSRASSRSRSGTTPRSSSWRSAASSTSTGTSRTCARQGGASSRSTRTARPSRRSTHWASRAARRRRRAAGGGRADDRRACAAARTSSTRRRSSTGRWRGHADFLLRRTTMRASRTRLRAWHYEVADTKLARHVKASRDPPDLLVCRAAHGRPGRRAGVPVRRPRRSRAADGPAPRRRLHGLLPPGEGGVRGRGRPARGHGRTVAYPPAGTYPEPVEHCDVCRWAVLCKARRRARRRPEPRRGRRQPASGAPSRRAGSRRGAGSPACELPMAPSRSRASARPRSSGSASRPRIQVECEDAGRGPVGAAPARAGRRRRARRRPRPARPAGAEPGRPVLRHRGRPVRARRRRRLPVRHPRARLLEDGRGRRRRDPAEVPRDLEPRRRRARDPGGREGRVRADVDLIIDRWAADPAMHVYHYAAYERTALGRLAQRHGDARGGGRPAAPRRRARRPVPGRPAGHPGAASRATRSSASSRCTGSIARSSSRTRARSIVAFETWLEMGADAPVGGRARRSCAGIEGYNRDDVVSNWRLRDWLEERRRDLEARDGTARPPGARRRRRRPKALTEREQAGRRARRRRSPPDDPGDPVDARRGPEAAGRWLLAQLLAWHRREDKSAWWRFFELMGKTDEELVDERGAARRPRARRVVAGQAARSSTAFSFPPQDHRIGEGSTINDPRTEAVGRRASSTVDDVGAHDHHHARARSWPASQLPRRSSPTGVVPSERARGEPAADRSMGRRPRARRGRSGRRVGRGHGRGPRPAAAAAAGRRAGPGRAAPARRRDGARGRDADRAHRARRASCRSRGRPDRARRTPARGDRRRSSRRASGSASSRTATRSSARCSTRSRRRRRGAASGAASARSPRASEPPTHAAATVLDGQRRRRRRLRAAHDRRRRRRRMDVVARRSSPARPALDVLVVDEAGQMSLANVVACAPAARMIVLLGDPQQLDQPTQGVAPAGRGAERAVAPARGSRLPASGPADDQPERGTVPRADLAPPPRRLRVHVGRLLRGPPAVASRGSSSSVSSIARRRVGTRRGDAGGTGLRYLPVAHAGNDTDSDEEAQAIAAIVSDLVAGGTQWIDRHGVAHPVTVDDIVIVAPYNAHVGAIERACAAAGLPRVFAGTVDKFQGQEAPISIYALGTSAPEDAPRGMEFLYSLNRLNVATSRARCVATIVMSPALVRVACHTPRQMRLANGLCLAVEAARDDEARAPRTAPALPPRRHPHWSCFPTWATRARRADDRAVSPHPARGSPIRRRPWRMPRPRRAARIRRPSGRRARRPGRTRHRACRRPR